MILPIAVSLFRRTVTKMSSERQYVHAHYVNEIQLNPHDYKNG